MSQETDQQLVPGLYPEGDQIAGHRRADNGSFDCQSDLEKGGRTALQHSEKSGLANISSPDDTCHILEQQKRQADDAKCNGIISFAFMALTLTMTCWLIHEVLAIRIEEGTMTVEELFWWIVTTMRVAILSLVVVLIAAVVDWSLSLDCMEPLT